jgi:sialic acid synthase SpsE
MQNVIGLIDYRNGKRSTPQLDRAIIAAAAKSALAVKVQLNSEIDNIYKHFDAVENLIETVEDKVVRTQLRETIKLRRQSLSDAFLELSRQIDILVAAQ